MFQYLLPFIFASLFFVGGASAQEAPRVYFSSPKDIYHLGETQIALDVLIDSDIEVNAFSLEIGYNVQVLAFLSASDEGSMVDVRQDFPPKSGEGVIPLRGGMTEPFSGEGGRIARLIFAPFAEGESRMVFRKAILYKADGKATPLWPKIEKKTIIVSSAASPPIEIVYDRTLPKVSDINFTRNPEDGALILSFGVADDRTGVKEVWVKWRNWILWGPEWPAKSPLAVPNGAWSAQIRARDGAGNEEIRTVIIWRVLLAKFLISIAALGVLFVVLRRIYTNRKRILTNHEYHE